MRGFIRPVAGFVVASLLGATLGGCATPESPDPMIPDTTALSNALTASLKAEDQQAFSENFVDSTTGKQLAEQWWKNLSQFNDVVFEPVASSQQLKVSWSVPGSPVPFHNTIDPKSLKVGEQTKILDLLKTENEPSWVFGEFTVINVEAGTLIASVEVSDADIEVWKKRMAEAVKVIKAAKLGELTEGWNSQFVVELLRSTQDYKRLVGLDPEMSSAATECETGAIRVVINPAVSGVPNPEGMALMVHEAVHAATASPCRDTGAKWATEGLAESIAAKNYKQTAAVTRATALAYVARNGMPKALPTNDDFSGDRERVSAAYALAQVAVDAIIAKLGQSDGIALIAKAAKNSGALDAATFAEVNTWYLEALAKLKN